VTQDGEQIKIKIEV